MINQNKFFLFIVFSILVSAFFFLLSNINYVKAMENKKQNATLDFRDYKFIAVGDCYCNKETEQLRDTYQQFFQQYGVNLIISDHNQYYEMSYPLLYNGQYEIIINKKINPRPIVEEFHTNEGNIIHNFKLGET